MYHMVIALGNRKGIDGKLELEKLSGGSVYLKSDSPYIERMFNFEFDKNTAFISKETYNPQGLLSKVISPEFPLRRCIITQDTKFKERTK